MPVAYLKANTRYGKDGVLYAANTDEDTERVQALVSGCERIDIKSGHDIHAEHPDTFVSACKRLLEGIDRVISMPGMTSGALKSRWMIPAGRVPASAITVKGMLTVRAWAYRPSVAVVGTGLPTDHA